MTKPMWMGTALLATTGLMAVMIGLLYSKGSADLTTQDRQPIAFSHEFHAGQLHIDCLYCHRFAHQSPTAGIPSMQLCIGCHQNVDAETKDTALLLDHWKQKSPVSWVRLQRLPDFVYFTHERHLAHDLQCVTCHGLVDQMTETPRAAAYEMGWCLSCHQQRGAPRDCWTCHK